MKNLITLLVSLVSFSFFAQAGNSISFYRTPDNLRAWANGFTFNYSADQNSTIYLQIFNDKWHHIANKKLDVSKDLSYAGIRINIGSSNSSVHYVQVKLYAYGRQVAIAHKTYGYLKKEGALSDTANAGMQLETYPNPVKDMVNLEYNLVKEGEVNVELYDPMGKLVKVIQNNKNQLEGRHTNTIDASALNAGMYIIKITTEEGTETSRILKQ